MTSTSKNIYSAFTDNSAPTATYNDSINSDYGQLVYPSDLFKEGEYSDSYTAFFISFKEDPFIDDSNTVTTSQFFESANYDRLGSDSVKSLNASDLSDEDLTDAVVGLGVDVAVGMYLHSKIKNIKGIIKGNKFLKNNIGVKAGTAAKYVAGGLTAAAGGTAIASNNAGGYLNISKDRKTQKSCICLPTPMIVTNYELNWSEESNKLIGGLLAGGADFIKNIKLETIESGISGLIEKFKNASGSVVDSIGSGITAAALSTPMIGTALGIMSREAANPRKEQLFKDVGMREFNISYVFAPTSEQESRNVESIIQQFKYHAHPAYRDQTSSGANGNLLNYPSEFDIVHYYNNKRNVHLPKHATSVLKRVSVDYSNGSDNYTFLPNGMPAIVKMDLTFVEIAMLTKEDILNGY